MLTISLLFQDPELQNTNEIQQKKNEELERDLMNSANNFDSLQKQLKTHVVSVNPNQLNIGIEFSSLKCSLSKIENRVYELEIDLSNAKNNINYLNSQLNAKIDSKTSNNESQIGSLKTSLFDTNELEKQLFDAKTNFNRLNCQHAAKIDSLKTRVSRNESEIISLIFFN